MESLIIKYFNDTKYNILEMLMRRVAGRLKKKSVYPAIEYPANQSFSLFDALQGKKKSVDVQTDNSIARQIKLPYANILRNAFIQPVSIKQRMFFRQKYRDTGDNKWRLMSRALNLKHPALDYMKDWASDSFSIALLLMESIREHRHELIQKFEEKLNDN